METNLIIWPTTNEGWQRLWVEILKELSKPPEPKNPWDNIIISPALQHVLDNAAKDYYKGWCEMQETMHKVDLEMAEEKQTKWL